LVHRPRKFPIPPAHRLLAVSGPER